MEVEGTKTARPQSGLRRQFHIMKMLRKILTSRKPLRSGVIVNRARELGNTNQMLLPVIRRVYPSSISADLVKVMPMLTPASTMAYINWQTPKQEPRNGVIVNEQRG